MTDDILDKGNSTSTDDGKNSKTFTQDELNQLIGDRLARQALKFEKQIADLTGERDKHKADVESNTGLLKKYQETLTGMLNSKKEKLPEPIRKLLASLDPMEQLTWIDENGETLKVEETKPTGVKPVPKPEPGKVLSEEEVIAQKKSQFGSI